MINKILLLVAVALTSPAFAQVDNSPTPIQSYYYDYKLANPAFTGTLGNHAITTVYSGTPGTPYGSPELFYASYERRLPSIKSAVGGIFIAEELGVFSRLHFGALYNKQFRFNNRSGLRVGTHVFYQRHSIDYRKFQFNDPNSDPTIGGDVIRTVKMNFDLGVVYYFRYATIGASLKNILHEDETAFGSVVVFREFKVNKNFKATPSILYTFDWRESSLAVNSTFEIARWVLLGAGYRFADIGELTFITGVNVKDWVQLIVHVYSSHEQKFEPAFYDRQFMEFMIRFKVPDTE